MPKDPVIIIDVEKMFFFYNLTVTGLKATDYFKD